MTEGHSIPETVLYAEGTVTYPPEMGIPDQHFVMRSANHPDNGRPDRERQEITAADVGEMPADLFAAEGMAPVQEQEERPSDEVLIEMGMAHAELHEVRGERAEDCPGQDCELR